MATDLIFGSAPTLGTHRSLDPSTSEWLVKAGLAAAIALAVGQVLTQVIDFQAYDLRIAALNSDSHWSVFGVASLLAQVFAATAAAMRGVNSARRAGWFLLSALLAVLVVVRGALPDDPTLLAPPVAAVFLMLWSLTVTDPTRPRRIVRIALLLLALSFVVHVVGLKTVEALGYGYNSWPYELKGIIKHTLELTGWVLVATGLLAVRRSTAPLRVPHDRLE